ncbi:hypothetical protein [Lysobacter gummosus]
MASSNVPSRFAIVFVSMGVLSSRQWPLALCHRPARRTAFVHRAQ